nr:hypothetical protein [Tanacetum cinerariifolium]
MATTNAYEETERVKVNCTLEDTLQQASTSGTWSDNAPVYDSNGSAEWNALSKQVTSNSAPSFRVSTIVNKERVIASGIFRINPFKASRGELFGNFGNTQCVSNDFLDTLIDFLSNGFMDLHGNIPKTNQLLFLKEF